MMKTENYCCSFMKEQMDPCEHHKEDCPEVIIARNSAKWTRRGPSSQGDLNKFILIGRTAHYNCNYCPECGAKL